MTTTPSDILEEARLLLADSATEVRRRTVCARAYYAAFHACWRLSSSLGFQSRRSRGVHGHVIQFLAGRQERSYRNFGRLLNDLRIRRNNADYELEIDVPRGIAEDAVEGANGIIVEISEQMA